jgi:hypothetical protein
LGRWLLIELDGEMKFNFHISNPATQRMKVRIVSRGENALNQKFNWAMIGRL